MQKENSGIQKHPLPGKNRLFFTLAAVGYLTFLTLPVFAGGISNSHLNVDSPSYDILTIRCEERQTGGRFHIPDGKISIQKGNHFTAGPDAGNETQYLKVDLGSAGSVKRISIPQTNPEQLTEIEVAAESGNWKKIGIKETGIDADGERLAFCLPSVKARYIRLSHNHTSDNLPEGNKSIKVWGYPVPDVSWIYDSKSTLAKNAVMERSIPHPRDPVLFSSGASGVQSHVILNGWLLIDSGRTGNGRVYWDYHQLPDFEAMPDAGYSMAMTGTFKFTPEIGNLSIKDGNHNTSGWELNGKLAFGGFGFVIRRTRVSSKAEYWHNEQGVGYQIDYPDGLKLVDDKEYQYLLTIRTRPRTEEVVLNAWVDFGSHGWVQVMHDRTWGREGWTPGVVPESEDREQILRGPSHIRRHHIWTRANNRDDERGVLPVRDVRIGVMDPLP